MNAPQSFWKLSPPEREGDKGSSAEGYFQVQQLRGRVLHKVKLDASSGELLCG